VVDHFIAIHFFNKPAFFDLIQNPAIENSERLRRLAFRFGVGFRGVGSDEFDALFSTKTLTF
jgi:hypothetical protein